MGSKIKKAGKQGNSCEAREITHACRYTSEHLIHDRIRDQISTAGTGIGNVPYFTTF